MTHPTCIVCLSWWSNSIWLWQHWMYVQCPVTDLIRSSIPQLHFNQPDTFCQGNIFVSEKQKLKQRIDNFPLQLNLKTQVFFGFPFFTFLHITSFFQMWLVHIVDKRKKASKDVEVNARQKDKFSSDIRDLSSLEMSDQTRYGMI